MTKINQICGKIGGVTLAVLSLASIAPAQALDYGFSFSNSTGGIPGTVNG